MNEAKREPIVVLFDGECNLCNGVVQFLILRDPSGERFRFAAQQSEVGQKLLREHGGDTDSLETMAVLVNDKLFTHSDAALQLARQLPFPWPLLYAGIIVPKPLRDLLYRFVAKNRYRWFGKQDQCLLPTPERKARFLT